MLEDSVPDDTIPLLDFDVEKAPTNCKATWDLLGKGLTKGVFQLESSLGKTWTRKLKPENLEHMAALGSLLRPGCLRAIDEQGVSMTQHYVRRKNGEESTLKYHPAIDAVLADTYGVLAYQEQSMAIAVAVAGFNEQEADQLRKAIGKKLPEEMAKCKKMFLDGAKAAGILTDEQAAEVFGWIEKSQRYAFNKSHAACYGVTGYYSAYIKAHFPIAFFTAWLKNAHEKQDPKQEVFELVNDAKHFDIEVEPPDLRTMRPHFHTDRKTIKFGLGAIKGIGDAQVQKLEVAAMGVTASLGKPISEWTWWEFLSQFSDKVSSAVVIKLIQVGALRWTNMQRSAMEAEFKVWNGLTDKEREWVAQKYTEFSGLIPALELLARKKKDGGGCATTKRIDAVKSEVTMLRNPGFVRVDTPKEMAYHEKELLGIALSCSQIESCDISQVNTTCKEFLAGRKGFMILGVEVQQVREVKTKKGANPGAKMAFLTVGDRSCCIEDVVCFPEVWKEYSHLLSKDNCVFIQADRDWKDNKSNALHVKKVWQADPTGILDPDGETL